jgi:hypothetical protein
LPKEKDAHLVKIRLKRKTTNLSKFSSKEFARVHKFAPQNKYSLPRFCYRHITPSTAQRKEDNNHILHLQKSDFALWAMNPYRSSVAEKASQDESLYLFWC